VPTFTHGDAQDLGARLKRAWERRDVDAVLELFAPEAELRPDPFEPALQGELSIRAWCNGLAAAVVHPEADVERVWISGDSVLLAFHGAWTERATGQRSRIRAVVALDLDAERRIQRARAWALTRVVGTDSTVGPGTAPADPS
jgi:ketosteroid isomerase-like protein